KRPVVFVPRVGRPQRPVIERGLGISRNRRDRRTHTRLAPTTVGQLLMTRRIEEHRVQCRGTRNCLRGTYSRKMPSAARVLLLCQGWARFECVEDDAGEHACEAADRFAAALAFALF